MALSASTENWIVASRSLASGRLARSRADTSREGPGNRLSPEVDIIDVRLKQRSGYFAATICAIMPPIEAPTICARAMPSASSRPTASAAIASSVYGDLTGSRSMLRRIAHVRLTLTPSNLVESPTSRLSKRMTRKPWLASCVQKLSFHAIICVPSPMINRIGGACASPNSS
jgi:hypothetical protein